jgi:hypothetical protein
VVEARFQALLEAVFPERVKTCEGEIMMNSVDIRKASDHDNNSNN